MNSTLLILIIILVLTIYFVFENKNLEVTYYTVHSNKIPKIFDQTKIVVLADLHNNTFGHDNQKLIDEIYKISPDYIIVAGDMIIGRESERLDIPFSLLLRLSKDFTIYYGLGNHEQRLLSNSIGHYKKYKEYKEELIKSGVIFLENDKAIIKRNKDRIIITGLAIHMDFYKKFKQPKLTTGYLQNTLGNPEKQCYNILIAHNPVYFKEYRLWGADVIVSGHLHGGIIRLPGLRGLISPQYKFFPKYDAGKFEENGKTLLVSRGLGLHTIKVRLFNRPELMVFTLEK